MFFFSVFNRLLQGEVATTWGGDCSVYVDYHLILLEGLIQVSIGPLKKSEKINLADGDLHLVKHGFYVCHKCYEILPKAGENTDQGLSEVRALYQSFVS